MTYIHFDADPSSRRSAEGTSTERAPEWSDRAKCARRYDDNEKNPYLAENVSKLRAKILCGGCPVKRECVNDALVRGGAGVRGGMTEAEWRA